MSDEDKTVILPNPGGRIPQQPAPNGGAATPPAADATIAPRPAATQNAARAVNDSAVTPSGLNLLVAAANPLLDIVPHLRTLTQHPDPAQLRNQLAQGIQTFEQRARSAGIANEKIIAARYALCTLLDETAASTPWGGSGIWANHSLLVAFHNESWGGEKFFQLLAKLAENPVPNRDLLELMYICLALGFQGRYGVLENGAAQLEALRERLAQMLRQQQGEYERDLSPQWQPAAAKRRSILGEVPLWIGCAVCALLLLVVYLGFSYSLNGASDPVYAQIQAIRVKAPVVAAPPPPPQPRLAQFLEQDILAHRVSVAEDARQSVVTIRGDGLFAPGSSTPTAEYAPLLLRIGDALNGVPGKVLVTGHTDNQPIRSLRFPSNWHLSNERAQAVAEILATRTDGARIKAEGRADADAIASNDTPAGRARNRRVEITLYPERVTQ